MTDNDGLRPCALLIREQVLKPEYPDTPHTFNSLALLLHYAGDYAGAEPLYRRVLALWEGAYGPESRELSSTLYNLGTLLGRMEKYEEAELLLHRELNICIAFAGDSDPETVNSMNNLAEVLQSRGDIVGMCEMRHRQLEVLNASQDRRTTKFCGSCKLSLSVSATTGA